MNEKEMSAAQNENAQREWEPPVIEELDFSATEAAYVPGAPVDLGLYTI